MTQATRCVRHRVITASGKVAGSNDPNIHQFHSFQFDDVCAALFEFRRNVQDLRDDRPLKILLTVSPVPLTATNSGGHVLAATKYSKSVLRATARQIMQEYKEIDDFPPCKLMTNQVAARRVEHNSYGRVRSKGVRSAKEPSGPLNDFCEKYT
ncbi:MAG: GSCFA domain-containing protein [Pseudomonadota bacterium]